MSVSRSSANVLKIAAIIFVTAVLGACDIASDGHGLTFGVSAQATDQWTRSYTIDAGGRLEIINTNGQITAEPASGSSLEVTAERIAKAATEEAAKELLPKIEIREEVGEGRIRLEVRAPRLSGLSGHEVKWTLKVPRGLSIDLRTENGRVNMTGLEGDIRARATNGGIDGDGLVATSLDAAVTNGGVEIELAEPVSSGTFDLEAVNGGVSLTLPPDSRADITGRCVNGAISTSGLSLEQTGEQTRRQLEARLNGGGARVSLQTVNGGVRIGSTAETTN